MPRNEPVHAPSEVLPVLIQKLRRRAARADVESGGTVPASYLRAIAKELAAIAPQRVTAHAGGDEADDVEFDVNLALDVFHGASHVWTRQGPDNRDEPRSRFAMRGVVRMLRSKYLRRPVANA